MTADNGECVKKCSNCHHHVLYSPSYIKTHNQANPEDQLREGEGICGVGGTTRAIDDTHLTAEDDCLYPKEFQEE